MNRFCRRRQACEEGSPGVLLCVEVALHLPARELHPWAAGRGPGSRGKSTRPTPRNSAPSCLSPKVGFVGFCSAGLGQKVLRGPAYSNRPGQGVLLGACTWLCPRQGVENAVFQMPGWGPPRGRAAFVDAVDTVGAPLPLHHPQHGS